MDVNLDNLRIDLPEKGRAAAGRGWKIVSLLLAVALVAFAVYHFAGSGKTGEGVVVETFPVVYSAGGSSSLFTAGGWVEPAFPYPVVVSALVSGRLDKLDVVESAQVEKGQMIAVLYKNDFEDSLEKAEAELAAARARLSRLEAGYRTEEVEQARAAAEQARAVLARMESGYREEEVEKSRAAVEECNADESIAKSVWERSKALFDKGAISKEELDKERAKYESACARSESAKQARKLLEAGYRKEDIEEARAKARKAEENLKLLEAGYRKEEIEEAKAAVQKVAADAELARAQLGYTEIKAPVSGRILELYVAQGDYVTAQKSAIVSIYDPLDMQVRVDVRQENVPRMRVGQRAKVLTDARKNEPYEGEVIRIDPKANLARDTIRAKVAIKSPDGLLYPEMTATVDFMSKSEDGGGAEASLILPAAAVVSEGGKDFVFVVADGRVRRTQVTLGEADGPNVAVISGVREGEDVAVTNVRGLVDGQRVQVGR